MRMGSWRGAKAFMKMRWLRTMEVRAPGEAILSSLGGYRPAALETTVEAQTPYPTQLRFSSSSLLEKRSGSGPCGMSISRGGFL